VATRRDLFAEVRGFWETDQLEWSPYTEEIAVILEKSYKDGMFEGGNKINISKKKKIRYVKEEAGTYRQYRDSNEANRDGRAVRRGYLGRVKEKEIPRKRNSTVT